MFQGLATTLLDLGIWQKVGLAVALLLASELVHAFLLAIYNIWFHPLRKFPGSKIDIAIPLRRYYHLFAGSQVHYLKDLHDHYGDVVRIAPDILSYTSPQAWKDIYGHVNDLPKATLKGVGIPEKSVFSAGKADHVRQRRMMNPAFSDKAVVKQEQLIRVHVDLLVKRLRELHGQATNAVRWYNLTTFDVMGDLAFGQSLQGLEKGETNQWIDNMGKQLQFIPFLVLINLSRVVGFAVKLTLGPKMKSVLRKQRANVEKLVQARLAQEDRGDIMDYLVGKMPNEELEDNADVMMLAGSHTSSAALSAITYYLLANPTVHAKVTEEVREAFADSNQISFGTLEGLPYLQAVIQEGLRIFPPIPIALNRDTTQPTKICGQIVPPQTRVGVPHLPACHSERNFHLPEEFRPERWLEKQDDKSPFYNDKLDACQPFSIGARNCIGQLLANHEVRLILAKVLYNFDLQLEPQCLSWNEQRIFALWELPPLLVKYIDRFEKSPLE